MPTSSINPYPTAFTTTTMLLGHRGARGQWAENSLQGFINLQQLAKSNVNQPQTSHNQNHLPFLAGVEFDIQMTADDELVVYHDASLERLHGQQGRIRQLTLAECQRLSKPNDIKNGNTANHDIITLTQLLPYLTDYRHIEMEIKTHAQTPHQRLAHVIVEQLQPLYSSQQPSKSTNHMATAVVVTSFDVHLLYWLGNFWYERLAKKMTDMPRLKLGLLIESDDLQKLSITNIINTAKQLRCCQLGLPCQDITAHMIGQCHQAGLAISAWTVNDIDLANWLIQQNIKSIISDYPSKMLSEFA